MGWMRNQEEIKQFKDQIHELELKLKKSEREREEETALQKSVYDREMKSVRLAIEADTTAHHSMNKARLEADYTEKFLSFAESQHKFLQEFMNKQLKEQAALLQIAIQQMSGSVVITPTGCACISKAEKQCRS